MINSVILIINDDFQKEEKQKLEERKDGNKMFIYTF